MNANQIWSGIELKAEDDYFSLTDDERKIYTLRKIMNAVNGRGLISLFDSGDYYYADDVTEDLYSCELEEIAFIIESANGMFPGGYPSEEPEERSEIIDSWDGEFDELFDQWTDDILEFYSGLEGACLKLTESLKG